MDYDDSGCEGLMAIVESERMAKSKVEWIDQELVMVAFVIDHQIQSSIQIWLKTSTIGAKLESVSCVFGSGSERPNETGV